MDKFLEKVQGFFDNNFSVILMFVAVLIIGISVTKIVINILKKIMNKTNIEHTAIAFLLSFIKVSLYLVVVITALSTIGVNVTSLITAVGAAALTAGLALQESLSNMVSGIIILFNKPFVAGDLLEFEGVRGKVESIQIFFTTIHTPDNKMVTIPNSRLTTNNVINCTMVDKRRVDLKYSISYDDDIAKVKGIIYTVISKNEKILRDPEPAVYVGQHLDSGLEIEVFLWTHPDDYYSVYYFMQENVKLAFDENSVTIPYPHIVVKNENN